MKKIPSLLLVCLLAFSMAFAQYEKRSSEANVLFTDVKTQLSNNELNEIYDLTGFALAKNGTQFYLKDEPETAEAPFDVTVYPLDLNYDGIEEMAFEYGHATDGRKAGLSTLLCVRDMEGRYRANFGFKGTIVFLNINPLTLPDILVRQSSFGYPIWRWNGDNYLEHKTIDSKVLRRMHVTYLANASKAYTAPSVRE
ncbi:MAG: hypothetical protein KJO77_09640 [Bacteroidia bacterium]|nr:hypothetical protein [Bacteroidia bacterium]NND52339.1 hypothetical protein [Flavobacteriaceae bacterium]